jgi:transcriptional regulator with XRE-family HTH domain
MKGISWEEGEKILLKDPKFAEERKRTEPEFQALRQLILLRRKGRISQEALANKVDMRQSHIARLESGEIRPSIKMLKRYATGLGYALELKLVPIKANRKSYTTI